MPGTTLFGETLRKLLTGLVLFFSLPLAASDLVSTTHFFPVVSRTAGLGGTNWSTAVQMVNPGVETLTVTARLSNEGAFRSESVTLAAGETRAWSDFLGEVFDFDGTGALMLEADADNNGGAPAERRSFAASMRISTGGFGGGSYGQGVPSLDPITGFLGDWTALFPAVALWGQPRQGGFRTNVGFWNIGAEAAQLRLRILDPSGFEVWRQTVSAGRHDPFVMALPRNLDLQSATLMVEPLDGWIDCAVYLSVVANMTGDASFLTSQLLDPDHASSGGGAATQPVERLRSLFLGDAR